MRTRKTLIAALAAAALLVGCAKAPEEKGSAPADSPSPTGSASPTDSAAPTSGSAVGDGENCGVKVDIATPPKKAITLNQGATEVMLALGLEDSMAGTAYLDDEIPEQWKAAYDKVKVLAKEYPSKEQFLAAKPDFAYASYASAFTTKDGVGTREELAGEKIATYLSPFGCPKGTKKADPTMENAWGELHQVAKIFGVTDRADKIVAEQKKTLETLKKENAGKGKTALWFDSSKKQVPYVGAGKGGPQIVMDTVGLKNIYADLDGAWGEGNWEKIVAADPDVIVLADASWDTAQKKIEYLESDPVLKDLKAVKAKAFVTVKFSDSTAGIRLVHGAQVASEQLAKLS